VIASVPHDEDLLLGDGPPSVSTQHAPPIERVDVGVPSPGEERELCRYALTT
jgi:hypothetical protein